VLAASTERLDRFLSDQLSLSRTQAARIVAAGGVRVNGVVARASRTLGRGELVEVEVPEEEPPRTLAPHPIDLTIVFEDEHLAVIDKPAGLVMHPAPGHWDDTLVNALVARGTALSDSGLGRPGIVHRLDRDTSGLLLVAKTDLAHRKLAQAIGSRHVQRAYAVLSWGHLPESPLVVDAPIGRHSTDRKRMVVRTDGRAARTRFEVVARFDVGELVRAELDTGRTHQIRVHLQHVGHPVIGDQVYGGGGARRMAGPGRSLAERVDRAATRQSLHSALLKLRHPITGQRLAFRSELPADLAEPMRLLQTVADKVDPSGWLTYLGFFKPDDG
jgi:23S rRNA pseudouridine1911/1915/1917 synthase